MPALWAVGLLFRHIVSHTVTSPMLASHCVGCLERVGGYVFFFRLFENLVLTGQVLVYNNKFVKLDTTWTNSTIQFCPVLSTKEVMVRTLLLLPGNTAGLCQV